MSDEQLDLEQAAELLRQAEAEVLTKRREAIRVRRSRDTARTDLADAQDALEEAAGFLSQAQASLYLSEATPEEVEAVKAKHAEAQQRVDALTGAMAALDTRIAQAADAEVLAERHRNVAVSCLANLHLEPALERLHWYASSISELLPIVVRLEAGARFNDDPRTGEGQANMTGVKRILEESGIVNGIYQGRLSKWTAEDLINLKLLG